MVNRVLQGNTAAERPAEQVHLLTDRHQIASGQQRMQVIGEVPQPATRVDRCPLRQAEAPEISRDAMPALTKHGHGLSKESRGGYVAVHEVAMSVASTPEGSADMWVILFRDVVPSSGQ
jgi:hypothetical protein